jgi:hypothetical protein
VSQSRGNTKEVFDAAWVAVMMEGEPVYVYLPIVTAAMEHFETARLATPPPTSA